VSVCTDPRGCDFSRPVLAPATPAAPAASNASAPAPASARGAGVPERQRSLALQAATAGPPPPPPSCPPKWPYSGTYRFTSDRRLVVGGLPVYRNAEHACFLVVGPGGGWLSACLADLPEYVRAPSAFPPGDRCGLGAGAVCYTEAGSCHCPFAAKPA
jgi:hypothetical protein